MPVTGQIMGPRGSEFWSSFNSDDTRLVAETLKAEFRRSEPARDIHYSHSGPDHLPPNVLNIKVSFRCLRDCLIFLLRGVMFIDGQRAVIEPGHAYVIKDEEWIGLGGNTTIFVMEEGEMKGICAQKLKEEQEKYRSVGQKKASRRQQNGLWNRMLSKLL